jgi:hypothetical protein
MPLPLIPILLAGAALWLLNENSSPGPGGSGGSGPFPDTPGPPGPAGGEGDTSETTGNGQNGPATDPEQPSPGQDTPDTPTGPTGPFFTAYQESPYFDAIEAANGANGLPAYLLGRVLWQESRLNPNASDHRNSNGTIDEGIAQINSNTARDPGYGLSPVTDPHNPDEAIPFAGAYLRALADRTGGDWRATLEAYNGGLGNVEAGTVSRAAQAYASAILNDIGQA